MKTNLLDEKDEKRDPLGAMIFSIILMLALIAIVSYVFIEVLGYDFSKKITAVGFAISVFMSAGISIWITTKLFK